MITINCNCGQKYVVPLSKAGKKGKCTICKTKIRIPMFQPVEILDVLPADEPIKKPKKTTDITLWSCISFYCENKKEIKFCVGVASCLFFGFCSLLNPIIANAFPPKSKAEPVIVFPIKYDEEKIRMYKAELEQRR
jgi:hypothetical protein